MTEFALKNSANRELKFAGELVSLLETKLVMPDYFDRQIELAVYAVDTGGFVALARFDSVHPDERSYTELEEMDSFEDVDKFFYVFDLYENIFSGSKTSRAQLDECSLRAKRLIKDYQKALFPFLVDVEKLVKARGLKDRDRRLPEKSGLWKLFNSSAS